MPPTSDPLCKKRKKKRKDANVTVLGTVVLAPAIAKLNPAFKD
jgi:hypothetical protein